MVTVADPGREFAFARTEPLCGTVAWRYRFVPEGNGTRVIESYAVTRPITAAGWFVIGTLGGLRDRAGDLHTGMTTTLERLAAVAEAEAAARR